MKKYVYEVRLFEGEIHRQTRKDIEKVARVEGQREIYRYLLAEDGTYDDPRECLDLDQPKRGWKIA